MISRSVKGLLPWLVIFLALFGILLLKSCSSAQLVSNQNPLAIVQTPSATQTPSEPDAGFPPETFAQILKTDISAQPYLELNGLATWSLIQRFPNPAQELINSQVTYVGNLGPVSVWVGFDVLGSIPVEAGAELSVNNGRVGVAYSGGSFVQRIRYEDGSGWDNTPEFDQGQFTRILEGQIDLNGFLQVGVNPRVNASNFVSGETDKRSY